MIKIETTDKGTGVVVKGTSYVVLSELTLAIMAIREVLKEQIPCLNADDLVRDSIRFGMMSDEDFDSFLDDQIKEIFKGK